MTTDSAPAASGAAGAEVVAPDEFQVQLEDSTWKAFSLDVGAVLIEAQTQGQPSMRCDQGGATTQDPEEYLFGHSAQSATGGPEPSAHR
jgi:hypothetical protein